MKISYLKREKKVQKSLQIIKEQVKRRTYDRTLQPTPHICHSLAQYFSAWAERRSIPYISPSHFLSFFPTFSLPPHKELRNKGKKAMDLTCLFVVTFQRFQLLFLFSFYFLLYIYIYPFFLSFLQINKQASQNGDLLILLQIHQ